MSRGWILVRVQSVPWKIAELASEPRPWVLESWEEVLGGVLSKDRGAGGVRHHSQVFYERDVPISTLAVMPLTA